MHIGLSEAKLTFQVTIQEQHWMHKKNKIVEQNWKLQDQNGKKLLDDWKNI